MNHNSRYPFPDSEILIFTKPPVPGDVKTRIAKTTGADLAARFSAALTEHTVKTVVESGLAPVSLWVANNPHHPFIQSLIEIYEVRLVLQSEGDLGDRMSNAFDSSLASKQSTVLIGTDCPFIDKAYLQSALTKLKQDNDIVIGPAEDGGYVLIGLKQGNRQLFDDIAWSQETVMQQARKQARLCGYRISELDMLGDIDYFEEIQCWQPAITSVSVLQEWLAKQIPGENDE